jgi:hypothetical protein
MEPATLRRPRLTRPLGSLTSLVLQRSRSPVCLASVAPAALRRHNYECWSRLHSMLLKGLTWLKDLIVWSWTYLWAAWFILVRRPARRADGYFNLSLGCICALLLAGTT